VIGDLGQYGSEIEFRVETVQLGRSNERVDRCGAFATGVGPGKQIILSSQSDRAQRTLLHYYRSPGDRQAVKCDASTTDTPDSSSARMVGNQEVTPHWRGKVRIGGDTGMWFS